MTLFEVDLIKKSMLSGIMRKSPYLRRLLCGKTSSLNQLFRMEFRYFHHSLDSFQRIIGRLKPILAPFAAVPRASIPPRAPVGHAVRQRDPSTRKCRAKNVDVQHGREVIEKLEGGPLAAPYAIHRDSLGG